MDSNTIDTIDFHGGMDSTRNPDLPHKVKELFSSGLLLNLSYMHHFNLSNEIYSNLIYLLFYISEVN